MRLLYALFICFALTMLIVNTVQYARRGRPSSVVGIFCAIVAGVLPVMFLAGIAS